MEKEILTSIGIIITLIGYAAYITSIFRGNTKPHPFSWIIWASLTTIAFFAQISDGAGPGAWITFTTAFMSFVIVALAYIKSEHQNITKSDWITFILAMTSIPLWLITDTPLWSVLLITIIDALGFYPTFRKSWHNPYDELSFHYIIAGLKFIFSLIALENFTVITALYPFSLIVMNWAFLMMQAYRKKVLNNEK